MKKLKNVFHFLLSLLLVNCVSTVEKKVVQDISQQSERTSLQASLAGREAILNSKNLTSEQKNILMFILNQTSQQQESLQQNESQIKASLYKYLATGDFNDSEFLAYRALLQDLEQKKLDLMFLNLSESRRILGKEVKLDPDLNEFERQRAER